MRPLLFLVGSIAAGWLVLLYPAYRLEGAEGVLASTAAMLLALAPAVAILVWNECSPPATPEGRLRRMALAMGLRMTVVLAGAIGLYLAVPRLHSTGFWVWVVVYYFLALALETALIARPRGPVTPQEDNLPRP